MLEILGKPTSINVRKVLWLCAELDLPYTLEPHGSGFQATTTPAFLALNPNGLVPVIRDDGFVLWESNTICRYLAAKHGRTDLLPADPAARARVEQWMDWQATDLNSAWRYAFMALVRRSVGHNDPVAIAASVQEWNRLMGVLDAQIARTGAHVVGEAFSLADIVLALSVNRWLMTPMERPALPAIAAYVERLGPRAGFRTHCANGVP